MKENQKVPLIFNRLKLVKSMSISERNKIDKADKAFKGINNANMIMR